MINNCPGRVNEVLKISRGLRFSVFRRFANFFRDTELKAEAGDRLNIVGAVKELLPKRRNVFVLRWTWPRASSKN